MDEILSKINMQFLHRINNLKVINNYSNLKNCLLAGLLGENTS